VALILNKTNMKKIIFTVAAIFAFGFANAQDKKEGSGEGFAKGDIFLSGAFGFGSSKTGDFKESAFEIAPSVAFFVSNNIAIGATIGYTSEKVDFGPADGTNNGLGLGVMGRYYFTPASKFSVFAQLGFDYTSWDNEYMIDYDGSYDFAPAGTSFESKEFGFGLGAGIAYHLSNHWSLEASWAGLGFTSNDNGGGAGVEKTDTFGLAANLRSLSFALNYKF